MYRIKKLINETFSSYQKEAAVLYLWRGFILCELWRKSIYRRSSAGAETIRHRGECVIRIGKLFLNTAEKARKQV